MNVWSRVKSLGWIKTAFMVLSVIALALAGAKATKKKASAKKKEEREQAYLVEGSSKSIQKAKALRESARKDIDAGVEAQKKMNARLESIGEANEDLDELMHRFNSSRVRHKPTS